MEKSPSLDSGSVVYRGKGTLKPRVSMPVGVDRYTKTGSRDEVD